MMDYLEKLFEKVRKGIKGMGRKKLIENCVVIVIIGIILIIAAGPLFKRKKDSSIEQARIASIQSENEAAAAERPDSVERKMEALLSSIMGAGKVEVMITYYTGIEKVTAFDIKKSSSNTEESDAEGGKRNISQSEYESSTIYEDGPYGNRQPVVLKEIYPEVKGVVVVADGAGNAAVRQQIGRAVAVLLDIPIHKVQVFERKK